VRRFHLAFGAVLVVVFVLTGQYMDKLLDHLHGMADLPRMLYRSRHIYVLFMALLNLGLGAYLRDASDPGVKRWQRVGSVLLAGSSIAMVVAFFYDSPHGGVGRMNFWWSRGAIYGIALGVLVHAAAAAAAMSRESETRAEAGERSEI